MKKFWIQTRLKSINQLREDAFKAARITEPQLVERQTSTMKGMFKVDNEMFKSFKEYNECCSVEGCGDTLHHILWEDCEAKEMKFDSDQEARDFCQHLADYLNCEIRLTNNENLLQGKYYRPIMK